MIRKQRSIAVRLSVFAEDKSAASACTGMKQIVEWYKETVNEKD